MVFNFGYRHEAWFGIGKASYDQSESFAFLVVVVGAGIACFIAPVMVFLGQMHSSVDEKELTRKLG